MTFLLYANTPAKSTAARRAAVGGDAEYSYRFLLDAYREMLSRSDTVLEIDSAEEADRYHVHFAARGEPCTLLAFCPPNLAPVGLTCPTICLFAWEFTTLPHGGWDDDPRNDWRHVFLAHGRAIAMSEFAAAQVRAAMGAYCEVAAIPAPVYDDWVGCVPRRITGQPRTLRVSGLVRDSHATGLGRLAPFWPLRDEPVRRSPAVTPLSVAPAYVPPLLTDPGTTIELDGMVFAAVFSPRDGRKNWRDLASAFIWAFRERRDATLVVKFIDKNPENFLPSFEDLLFKCGPFACRVVAICGWLDDRQMRDLASCADFYVNTSHGEGMCLPLAEFMSAGVPAIAPDHTAMADYIRPDNAFIVRSSLEHDVWPNDPEGMFRTMRYRLEWDSVVDAYHDAARLLDGSPEEWRAMSDAARETMRGYCSRQHIRQTLRQFLGETAFTDAREQDNAPEDAETC